MTLIGISDQNQECRRRGYKNYVHYILEKLAHDVRPKWENPKGHVLAAISKKRWYVKCPGCAVNIGIDEDSSLFFCWECLNIANDMRPQHIKFPNKKRINELMALRPDYRNRNYLPHHGETLKDVEAENIEHGWSKI